MKKISNIILLLTMSFMFSGCATALLFTGTVVGGVYIVNDIEDNYDGDGSEYIKDKTINAYESITEK